MDDGEKMINLGSQNGSSFDQSPDVVAQRICLLTIFHNSRYRLEL